jgi:hypothetical protein
MNQLPKVFPAAVVQEHFYLSFQIRAAVNDAGPWQIDITSPRLEQHHAAAHRGLAAQYFPDLPYAQAWRRRDFTINAMGVEYRRTMTKTRTGKRKEQQAYRLIDPFNGWGDWQQKKLNIISEDFYQDPVRFLRFCRWLEQGFTAGERSVAQGRMDLSLLSKQLLGREALKGNFFALMAAFIKWGKAWQVKWPAWPIGDWPWERWAAINDRPFSTIAAAAKTIWECDPAWGQRFWEFWELSLKEGQRIQQAVAWWAKVQQLPWVEMRELNRCGPALRRDPPPHPLPAWLNLFAKSCKAGRCPLKVVQPPWAQEVCGPWTQMIELFGRRPGEDEKTYLAKWSATYPPEEQDALKAYAFLLFRRF